MPLMPKWKGEMRFRETKRKNAKIEMRNAKCKMMIFTTIFSQKSLFFLLFYEEK